MDRPPQLGRAGALRRGLGTNARVKEAVKRSSWRTTAYLAGVGFVLAAGLCAVIFQDNIARFFINPRTPFQTMTPPPAPDYRENAAWALRPKAPGAAGAADVFFIHATTYYSPEQWNADFDDSRADALFRRTAGPNQAGPFHGLGGLFAPRYRQATLFSFFTQKYDGVAARKLAFSDIARAFDAFAAQTQDRERPFFVVGYGQGGLHALGLLKTRIAQSDELRRRLAAAYIIGQAVPPEFFKGAGTPPPCAGPQDFRCLISYVDFEAPFDEEMRRIRARSMVFDARGELNAVSGDAPLCVNPLNWTRTEAYIGPENHVGAASATGLKLGETPSRLARAIGAQCERGILVVDRPPQSYLRRRNWFGAKWRARNFNLFYHDLAEDAARRARLAQEQLTKEATILDPIENAVEIGESPVNKVPR